MEMENSKEGPLCSLSSGVFSKKCVGHAAQAIETNGTEVLGSRAFVLLPVVERVVSGARLGWVSRRPQFATAPRGTMGSNRGTRHRCAGDAGLAAPRDYGRVYEGIRRIPLVGAAPQLPRPGYDRVSQEDLRVLSRGVKRFHRRSCAAGASKKPDTYLEFRIIILAAGSAGSLRGLRRDAAIGVLTCIRHWPAHGRHSKGRSASNSRIFDRGRPMAWGCDCDRFPRRGEIASISSESSSRSWPRDRFGRDGEGEDSGL